MACHHHIQIITCVIKGSIDIPARDVGGRNVHGGHPCRTGAGATTVEVELLL